MATEEQTSYNADIIISGRLPRVQAGQRVTITNRIVSKLAFVLHKLGSPVGNVTFQILKVSDNSIIVQKVWGNAADLQTDGNEQLEEVEFTTPTFINEEVRLIVYYPEDDIENYRIELHYQNTDVKADELLTYRPTLDSGWTDAGDYDAAYRYTYEEGTAPTVTTQVVTNIAATTATGNGNITGLGNPTATQHGHCWNTTGTPTITDSKTENGVPGATGAFTSNIINLVDGTLYYVRAYATNDKDTSYGEVVQFRAGGESESVYPSDAITRVTGLVHRYSEGTYTLELLLGEVIADFGLPEWEKEGKPRKAVEEKEPKPPKEVEEEAKVREVSIQEDIDKFKRLQKAAEEKAVKVQAGAQYDLEQEIEKFKRLAEEAKAKLPPPPAPILPPEIQEEIEQFKRKAAPLPPPAPKPRQPTPEEEFWRYL